MVPDETFPNITNCIGIAKGLINDADNLKRGHNSLGVAVLRIPDGYRCVDLSLYKVSMKSLTEFNLFSGVKFSPLLLTGRTTCVAAK